MSADCQLLSKIPFDSLSHWRHVVVVVVVTVAKSIAAAIATLAEAVEASGRPRVPKSCHSSVAAPSTVLSSISSTVTTLVGIIIALVSRINVILLFSALSSLPLESRCKL